MNYIKVSIIIPVYKVPENYLRKCIESCINQSLKDIEIILVDDGSPDNCGKICDKYALKDNRIKVIHKKNEGLSAARNTGFLAALGKWIMFVDGDDWIEPIICEELYTIGEKENVQLVMCNIAKEYKHRTIFFKIPLINKKIYNEAECKSLQQQLLNFNANMTTAYAKLIDKSFLISNNLLHDKILRQGAEGIEFNLRVFEVLKNLIFIDKPMYHYIYNEESISSKHSEKNHKYVIKCFDKIRKFIDNSKNKDKLLPYFYNRLLYVIITTAISGYFNPENKESYSEKVRKYKQYLNIDLIKEALKYYNVKGMSKQRKFILYLIRNKYFFALNIMGYLRKWQKSR